MNEKRTQTALLYLPHTHPSLFVHYNSLIIFIVTKLSSFSKFLVSFHFMLSRDVFIFILLFALSGRPQFSTGAVNCVWPLLPLYKYLVPGFHPYCVVLCIDLYNVQYICIELHTHTHFTFTIIGPFIFDFQHFYLLNGSYLFKLLIFLHAYL